MTSALKDVFTMKHLVAAGLATGAVQLLDGGDVLQNLVTYGGATLIGCTVEDMVLSDLMPSYEQDSVYDMLVQAAVAGGAGSSVLALADFIPGGFGSSGQLMAAAIIGGSCVVGSKIAKSQVAGAQ